jgi:hypothetical protein
MEGEGEREEKGGDWGSEWEGEVRWGSKSLNNKSKDPKEGEEEERYRGRLRGGEIKER